jgi:predicted Fe-Mo cluster-binding NifX family protein
MKIAVISNEGTTISQHFGMAPLYVVATVENGKVTNKETRNKMGHQHFGDHPHHEEHHGERHGFDADAQDKHAKMAQNIDDCQVLLAGGMGWGAFESMKQRGLEVVITDVKDIDEALNTYLKGELPNLMEKLH